jgi:hypothetical protein
MQIPCGYIPGPAPAVSVANTNGEAHLTELRQRMGELGVCPNLTYPRIWWGTHNRTPLTHAYVELCCVCLTISWVRLSWGSEFHMVRGWT